MVSDNANYSKTILVVDDDPDVVSVITDVLTLAGYRVKAARLGREGLRIALEERPDLILLDVVLTDMCGTEFAATYREHMPAEQRAPLVITTAHADAVRLASESEANGVLTKPFDIDDLVDCVDRTLRSYPRAA